MKLTADLIDILTTRTATDGPHLTLTGPRMTPQQYQRINDVLEGIGGQWSKTVQAHVFPGDAAAAVTQALAAGEVVTLREKRQQAQYFPTPAVIVQRVIELAEIEPGMEVLEPSAGSGSIATAAAAAGAVVDCIERDPGYAAGLDAADVARALHVADFLAVPAEPRYDRVVMNPPFTQGADMQHVQHALRFLKPDGLLVSVMSWTVAEQTRKTVKFRALVEARGGTVEAVAERAFKESGTDVPTVIVAVPAIRPADAKPTVWPQREAPEKRQPEFQDPMEILNELRANLCDAMAEFDALAELLAKPMTASKEDRQASVLELPEPRQEQLSIDGLGETA